MSDVTVTPEATITPGINQFAPWATGPGANVTPLSGYLASPQLSVGVTTGIADPLIYNRAVRQATFIAAGIAQFTANEGYDVPDDGNLFGTDSTHPGFIANFTAALAVATGVPLFATNAQAAAGNSGNTIISPASLNFVLDTQVLELNKLAADGTTLLTQTVSGPVHFQGAVQANAGLTTNALTVQTTLSLPPGSVTGAMLANGTVANVDMANMPVLTVKANTSATVPGPPTDSTIQAVLTAGGVVLQTNCGHYQGTQPNGTSGSGEVIPANAWKIRLLNTDTLNPAGVGIPGSVLSANQLTLPIGTYKARFMAIAQATINVSVFLHKVRLRNNSDQTTLIVGTNSGVDASGAGAVALICQAFGQGIFRLTAAKTIQIESLVSQPASGGPVAAGIIPADASQNELEVYTDLVLEKIA